MKISPFSALKPPYWMMENKTGSTPRPLKPVKPLNPRLHVPPERPQSPSTHLPLHRNKSFSPPSITQKKKISSLPWSKWLAQWTGLIFLFSGTSFLAVGTWFSLQLIVDPDLGLWVNQQLPKWTHIPIPIKGSTQSLEQIQGGLKRGGFIAGKPIPIPKADIKGSRFIDISHDILLPVLVNKPDHTNLICQNSCQQVIELRVYQSVPNPQQDPEASPYYRLINQFPVEGPAASFLMTSIKNPNGHRGPNKSLPIFTVEPVKGNSPTSGIWLNLTGEFIEDNQKIIYGQVWHYHPKYYHLLSTLDWVSSSGRIPLWEPLSRGGKPQLIIDQSQGLDPKFTVYQVTSHPFIANPIQLTPFSLETPAIDQQNYRESLWLARSGLWSNALEKLTIIRAKRGNWSEKAQLQMDLVRFHANITRAQAQGSWSSISQKVLANLMDGQWKIALDDFKNNPQDSGEIARLLKQEGEAIWRRIDTALKLNPNQQDIQTWGALTIAAQGGRSSALNWLLNQGVDRATRREMRELINQMEKAP